MGDQVLQHEEFDVPPEVREQRSSVSARHYLGRFSGQELRSER